MDEPQPAPTAIPKLPAPLLCLWGAFGAQLLVLLVALYLTVVAHWEKTARQSSQPEIAARSVHARQGLQTEQDINKLRSMALTSFDGELSYYATVESMLVQTESALRSFLLVPVVTLFILGLGILRFPAGKKTPDAP